MKRSLFFWLFVVGFCFNQCKTQSTTTFLQLLDYKTITYNRIAQVTTENDTLIITESRFSTITQKIKYLIEATETRGDLLLLYAKLENIEISKSTYDFKKPVKPYSLFILSFSTNKDKMYLLQENKLWYGSLSECKSVNMDSTFKDKYFFTYFSSPYFDSFKKLKNFGNVDSVNIKTISDNWSQELENNKKKVMNTHTHYGYGVNLEEDILNKILIKYNFNPIDINMASFSKKMEQYHIKFPKKTTSHSAF